MQRTVEIIGKGAQYSIAAFIANAASRRTEWRFCYKYQKEIDMPAEWLGAGKTLEIDLGDL